MEGGSFDGIVKRISPQADESTGGFMVEIHVVNKGNVIKAAEDLHISKAPIYRKIKTYSIDLKKIKKLA